VSTLSIACSGFVRALSSSPKVVGPLHLHAFIAWLIPWSWFRDSRACSQVTKATSTFVETTELENQTDEFPSVSDNDLEYLTRGEAEQIVARFEEIPQSYDRLVSWTIFLRPTKEEIVGMRCHGSKAKQQFSVLGFTVQCFQI
jgi:hypothetical protein